MRGFQTEREGVMSTNTLANVLVNTDWVAQHATDTGVRVVEVDVDTTAYDQGHVPGSAGWNWTTELCDTLVRDIVPAKKLEALLGASGIDNKTTIVLYGDNNNWFAAWAFWQLKYYGHEKILIMNGGRKKWLEEKRPLATARPAVAATAYRVKTTNAVIRAKRDDIFAALDKKSRVQLVDVRSVDEFTGKIIAPPGMTETAQRAGHIPQAANIPWAQASNEDGTFKSFDDLKKLYEAKGINGKDEVIAYCRIGERSSHTWFVLKYLLGFNQVRNY